MMLTLIVSPILQHVIIATDTYTNDFDIKVVGKPTTEETEIQISDIHSEIDSIVVSLPESVSNEGKISKVNMDYVVEGDKLILDMKKGNNDQVGFILTNTKVGENKIDVEGFVEQRSVGKSTYSFTAEESQEDKVTEEATDEIEVMDKDASDTKSNHKSKEEKKGKETPDNTNLNKGSTKEESDQEKKDKESTDISEDSKKVNKGSADSKNVVVPFAGTLNYDIDISPKNENVESGKVAIYDLNFKTTGSQIKYRDSKIVIDFPKEEHTSFTQDLEGLAIEGVIPELVEGVDTLQLVYEFEVLHSGRTYEHSYKLNTENGYIKNNTPLEVSAKFEAEEIIYINPHDSSEINGGSVSAEDTAKVNIQASSSISIDKEFTGEVYSGSQWVHKTVSPNDDTKWTIKIAIPKKETGQMYLQEGSKIVVTDTLPSGLSHYSSKLYNRTTGEEITPTISGDKITFEVDAPSYEIQETAEDNIFVADVLLYLQAKSNSGGTLQTNTAELEATFINDEKITEESSDSLTVARGGESSGGASGYVYATHYGPLDGNGNNSHLDGYYDINKLNPVPTVTDEDTLQFAHGIDSMQIGAHARIPWMQYYYHIDNKLVLTGIHTPGTWAYHPTTNYTPGIHNETNPNIQYVTTPDFHIYVSIAGGEQRKRVVANANSNHYYSREDLGLNEDDKITRIEYYFYNGTPAGMSAFQPAKYFFDIEKGARGTVENYYTVKTATAGVAYDDRSGSRRYTTLPSLTNAYDSSYDTRWTTMPEEHHFYWRNSRGDQYRIDRYNYPMFEWVKPRQATIVDNIPEKNAIAKVGIELEENEKGKVELGENRMEVNFKNVESSPRNIKKDLQAAALLPLGVSLSDNLDEEYSTSDGTYEIIDNYNNSGRQMIIFTWKNNEIEPGESLSASVNVEIEDSNSSLLFDVYGFSGNRYLRVPKTTGNSITDTLLQTDEGDINGINGEDEPRLKSSNQYYITGKYDLETEKFVKVGNEDWSKFTSVNLEGIVDYKLVLTNTTGKDISYMRLIDVMPTIGDLGITDNVSRGTKFDMKMVGPINIPDEWKDKVNVYYSKSKNPKRDELFSNTEWPETTTQYTNPNNAENPQWLAESEIGNNWSEIHSFKIELAEDEKWIQGQGVEITYSMQAPEISNEIMDLLKKENEYERAAWNSFAIATEKGQPVEPAQVGVTLTGEYGGFEIIKIEAGSLAEEEEDAEKERSVGQSSYANIHAILLDGAEFKLTADKNGENIIDATGTNIQVNGSFHEGLMKELTTDENGILRVVGLTPGTYWLHETKTPIRVDEDGKEIHYQLLKKPVEITVEGNKVIKRIVENEKLSWNLPETGNRGIYLFILTGLLLLSVTLLHYFKDTKKTQDF